ncbi:MAG: sulfatase/phosphatase domain-containing protein, partial [Rubripirellula sp.]
NLAEQGHLVSGNLRGSKADLWDGGHRLPFIVRWPSTVQPGTVCNQLICHTDLFATVAELTQQQIPNNAAEDSVSFLPALHEKEIITTRNGITHHSFSGHFAYRRGRWKLLLAKGSGGWTSPRERDMPNTAAKVQLYDMATDIGERRNLQNEKPELVQELLDLLKTDIQRGRSTDGPKATNDINRIDLWKIQQANALKKKSQTKPPRNKNKN